MKNEAENDLVYLKATTKVEPLAFRWYAWGHLISPVQQAFYLAFKQIPMLKSFVANPRIHEAAWGDPEMLGGNFLELRATDAELVQRLLRETIAGGSNMVRFAEDFLELSRGILKTATGFSLDHDYDQLTDSLSGLLELSYDVANQPSLRVIEELATDLRLQSAQGQELMFEVCRDENRRFFLNTPRLDRDSNLAVAMPFADPRIDLLASSRISPVSFREIIEDFRVDEEKITRFREFFTPMPPLRSGSRYGGEGVRIRYFGHACVLVETKEVSLLIDPFVAWDTDANDGRLTFYDLPERVDYVFLSHNHQDHFCPEVLLQLRHRIGRILVARNNPNCIADPSMKQALRALGFSNVTTMDPMDTEILDGGRLISLPFYGEHADLNIASKHGLFLELEGRKFLFLADSDCKDRMLYRRVAAEIGNVETLFIGMECHGAPLSWLYSPYQTNPLQRKNDESRRLSGSDCSHAWAIVEEFGCSKAYVYGMGQEPWLRFVAGLEYDETSVQLIESDKFVDRCLRAGLAAERLFGCCDLSF